MMTKDSGRHAKMFDLLRQGDLDSSPRVRAKDIVPRYADEDAVSTKEHHNRLAERYLDDSTARQMIVRGASSFKVPGWLNQSSERATQRTALFLTRQTD